MIDQRKTAAMDGNEAAAHVAYAFTEVAAIYPITPSSPMAEKTDEWAAGGRKNLFGQPVRLIEMQSEAGAIGAVHGASEAGVLATSFTSSQGLMLMIPVMHRIAGTRQPAVLHVASRTVGTHAMSIFGDQSDVMNCRGTGFALLSSGSVQEVMDLGAVAHLAAIRGRVPFLHFFDGFRTSHEIQKIRVYDQEQLAGLLDWEAVEQFRDNALNPDHPTLRNTVQNPDIYFQVREANNRFYDALPGIVEDYLSKINAMIGSDYHLFNYYGDPAATRLIIAMGSVSGTIRDTVAYLNQRGEKVGFLQVHLYRPFSLEHFLSSIPKTVERIAVLDRCKEHGALGEPLYQDVCAAYTHQDRRPLVVGGRYGLSSKDTDPAQIKAVFDNLLLSEPKNNFSVGIVDDVTHLSLPVGPALDTEGDTVCCKFWGLGSDGTVGANKNSIKIISEHTDQYTQAYFEYDTKKSFGITKSHLRFGHSPIRGTHLVKRADFVACHNQSYLGKYDILPELKPGGTFLLNCSWKPEQLDEHLPAAVKSYIANNHISFYIIDGTDLAEQLGLGNHANMILQAAFFRLAGIIPVEEAVGYMKDAVKKTYGRKGDEVVAKNMAAIDAGIDHVVPVPVPESWKTAVDAAPAPAKEVPPVIRDLLEPINALKGDDLPVSTFIGYEDGTMPLGTSAYEKRGIATHLPVWSPDACLQCNQCAYVCPHGVLRPYLLDEEEAAKAPAGFPMVPAKGGAAAKPYQYALQISNLDCTSCGCCASVCPAAGKALVMKPADEVPYYEEHWEYGLTLTEKEGVFKPDSVKGSQFKQPLLEFSGACAGCGETPYAKLLTQLFGDRMYWANATGCSQAWGAAMPCIPYTVNRDGEGPAWSNSLFENNAEFSLGMALASQQQRARVRQQVEQLLTMDLPDPVRQAAQAWLDAFDQARESKRCGRQLADVLRQSELTGEAGRLAQAILRRRDQLGKKSIWMFGGDGWAYDIGFGGLDHVVAMEEDVNVLVVDTEVYSNTGGQSSKATPLGAAAQFQASGKKSSKKDLGRQLMAYGNIYVAQVAMGADQAQLIRALEEADAYPGPSVVIAYTPCISHGLKVGMCNAQQEMKRAVQAGYWHLYRYNPLNTEHPFTLDSKEPTMDFHEFLEGEVRYSALERTFPDNARTLFARAEREAKEKYRYYKKLEQMYQPE